jgi:hypothetical protein
MIKHIQDAISYGLYEGFWAEDSILVTGFHECFGEQLDCEAFSSWPDEKEAGVLHLALGEGKQFKISIEEEQTRQLDITPVESEIAKMSRISKAGEAKDFYNVHDTITIDGIEFEIVGIGHDIDALTGRNNTITLRQVDHLKKSRINPGPCPDGYAASELDQSLIESPQSWIPDSILPYVVVLKLCIASCGFFPKAKCLVALFIRLPRTVGGMRRLQQTRTGLPMTRTAPLVVFGCAPHVSAAPASSVWSTRLGARALTLPITRVAWRWASVFNL